MSISRPANRTEFRQYCLRQLGKPVLRVNVDDDQIEDCIDYALQFYWDYHFDGTEKVYFKYIIQDSDLPNHVSEIAVANSGTGYNNADLIVITANTADNSGNGAVATLTTDNTGGIVSVSVANSGTEYFNPPGVSVANSTGGTANGTGAVLVGYNGGYIKLPENIIGAINIFDVSASIWGGAGSIFNIQYQIALNDLYTIASTSMVPYFLARMNIQEIGQWFVGKQPVRYNRHTNRFYLDMDWQRVQVPGMVVVEAYQVVDPDLYIDVWNDRWLKRYATAHIKKLYGTNLKKYGQIEMPGRVIFNGQIIYDEAVGEIAKLEDEMINSYSIPVIDMIG